MDLPVPDPKNGSSASKNCNLLQATSVQNLHAVVLKCTLDCMDLPCIQVPCQRDGEEKHTYSLFGLGMTYIIYYHIYIQKLVIYIIYIGVLYIQLHIYICICDTIQITKHRDIARTSAVKWDSVFFWKSNIEKMTRKNGNCRTIPQGNDLDAVFSLQLLFEVGHYTPVFSAFGFRQVVEIFDFTARC